MKCLSNIIPKIECKTFPYNHELKLYFKNKKGAKKFRLLAKQYIIDGFEVAGSNGYFTIDGIFEKSFNENYIQIRPTEPQYKINYSDRDGNRFFWLLTSNEINININ